MIIRILEKWRPKKRLAKKAASSPQRTCAQCRTPGRALRRPRATQDPKETKDRQLRLNIFFGIQPLQV
jgi:hypothetical protein